MTRPLLYIIAPYVTATEPEKVARLEVIRRALALGYCPIFAPFLFERAYPEETPELRSIFLDCDRAIMDASDAVLVIGKRNTEGVIHDLAWWERVGSGRTYEWPMLPKAVES